MVEKPVEGTVEATVGVHEEQKEPGKGETGAGNYGGSQDDNRIEVRASLPVSRTSRSTRRAARNTANRESRASRPARASQPLADPTMLERKGLTANLTKSPFVTSKR